MKKVLVIEDNPDNLKLITYALTRAGYKIASAPNGETGVALAEQLMPDFIILDIDLPGIDGYETARRIRASRADGSVPIIAITSYAMLGDRDRIIAAGCNGYFEKPIDPLTIVEKIEKIIGTQMP